METSIFDPWGSETFERILMKPGIYTSNYVRIMTTRAKIGGAARTWVVLVNTWLVTFYFLKKPFFLSFFSLYSWVAPRPNGWTDFDDLCVITRCFCAMIMMRLLAVALILPPFIRSSAPKKLKRGKYSNFRVIKTSAAIPTKFGTVMKISKCSLRVVPKCAPSVQDGGRPPS